MQKLSLQAFFLSKSLLRSTERFLKTLSKVLLLELNTGHVVRVDSLNRQSGDQVGGNLDNESLMGADFTGTVSEWYETLAETINDVSAQIHRKTLRGGANFVVCSPEVANILEFTAGFRASIGTARLWTVDLSELLMLDR